MRFALPIHLRLEISIVLTLQVNISGLTADSKTLRAFSEALPQLSSVTYANMVSVGDKAIWSMFIQNGVNIRKIDLRGCKLLKGYCLKSFSAKLEHVSFDWQFDQTFKSIIFCFFSGIY